MIRSMVERAALKMLRYVFSDGCIASQKTYLLASEQMGVFRLHKKDASRLPVPQQPLLTSSKPVS